MTTFYYVAGPYFLFGLAVFAFWFVFGMLSIKLVRSKKEAVLLLNAPAFLVLLLYLFQEIGTCQHLFDDFCSTFLSTALSRKAGRFYQRGFL